MLITWLTVFRYLWVSPRRSRLLHSDHLNLSFHQPDLPLLEETGFMPRKKYSEASEMLSHAHRIADKWSLWSNSYFQTEVKSLVWNEEVAKWTVRTDRGDEFTATVR